MDLWLKRFSGAKVVNVPANGGESGSSGPQPKETLGLMGAVTLKSGPMRVYPPCGHDACMFRLKWPLDQEFSLLCVFGLQCTQEKSKYPDYPLNLKIASCDCRKAN